MAVPSRMALEFFGEINGIPKNLQNGRNRTLFRASLFSSANIILYAKDESSFISLLASRRSDVHMILLISLFLNSFKKRRWRITFQSAIHIYFTPFRCLKITICKYTTKKSLEQLFIFQIYKQETPRFRKDFLWG